MATPRPTTCPACGRSVLEHQAVCECERILSIEVLRHSGPKDRILPDEPARLADEGSDTNRFDPVERLQAVIRDELRLVPRTDTNLFREDLSALELYCYSRIDRSRSWSEICKLTGFGRVESCVIILSLLNKGAVTTVRKRDLGQATPAPDRRTQRAHATTHFALASAAIEEGNPTGAAWHLRKAIAFSPTSEYATALEKVLDTGGRKCDRHYHRVRGHLSGRQPQRALAALEEALNEFPGEAGFHNLKAVVIMASLGDIREAIASLRRAVRIDPFNEAFQLNLDRLLDRERAG